MTNEERKALLNIIYYLLSVVAYLAGSRVPDNIAKNIKTLEKGKKDDRV